MTEDTYAITGLGADTARAMQLIRNERARQVGEEGWTAEHDDAHDAGELALAAASYALTGLRFEKPWPWDFDNFKPTTRERDLVKAGALIVAELERLERAKKKEEI